MRTLTNDTATAANSQTAKPILILKLEVGGATGDVYYADRDLASPITASGRIVSAGSLNAVMEEDGGGGHSSFAVTLQDADLTLKTLLENNILAGKRATLYQHFASLGESDMAPLMVGLVEEGAAWSENGRTVTLAVGDLDVGFRDRLVGRRATPDEFAKLPQEEEGKLLPLVYGETHRVKAVLVEAGAATETVFGISAAATEFVVKDASRFPGGAITVRLGQEEMQGSFSGNTFTVTQRPRDIETGTLSHKTGKFHILRATGLAATNDNEYAGLFLKLTIAGREQLRRITQYVAATGALVIDRAFIDADGQAVSPDAGTAFAIVTLAAPHQAGEAVQEVLDAYVYLVSDDEVEAIVGVEGWGVVEPEVAVNGVVIVGERRGHITVPSRYYAANASDTTTFPSLGRTVATLRLPRLPAAIPDQRFTKNELFVSVKGRPQAGGGVMDNPVDIIEHLLKDIAGVASADIDSASFSAAKTARAGVKMAFALDGPRAVSEIVSSIAFQARLALLWEGGQAKLRALSNALGSSVTTFDKTEIEFASGQLSGTRSKDIVTEITAKYTHRGAPAALTVKDEDAETEHGRKAKEVQVWAFATRHQVLEAAEWWLRRWKHRYRQLTFSTFLPGLAIERHDVVTIDHDGIFAGPVAGIVTAVDHRPGNLARDEMERITFAVRLPFWGGCASSCEVACETGCEAAACELSCTTASETGCTWTCEVSCEEACQLGCTVSCQLSCQGTCQISCRQSGESIDTGCVSSCEIGCETGCESGFESSDSEECDSGLDNLISPIREAIVLTPPTAPSGAATVIECDKDGSTYCVSFTAHDTFDLHPAAGDRVTVYLNFNYQWVIVPGGREAKYVRVTDTGDSAGLYEVIEQNHLGDTWGEAFYAWAVDSV